MSSRLNYSSIIDISIPHEVSAAGAPLQLPFTGSTVYYRKLVDRADSHPDLEELGDDEIAEVESNRFCARYWLDGYGGTAMVLDVTSDREELSAGELVEAVKRFQEMTSPMRSRMLPAPMPPDCLLLRRIGTAGETFLSTDAVLYLCSLGVRLVGVESNTIAAAANQAAIEALMGENDLSWLVRVALRNVESNMPFYLCAFPVSSGNTGAAPCRAVLVSFNSD